MVLIESMGIKMVVNEIPLDPKKILQRILGWVTFVEDSNSIV